MKYPTINMIIRKRVENILGRSRTSYYKEIPMKSWMVFGLLILITYGLSPSSSLAMQKREEIKFENLTIEDGLSQSSVFAILQDKQGMMWFGTWKAL